MTPVARSDPDNAINLEHYVRAIPDFPQPGIVFRDITPLLLDPRALDAAVTRLTQFGREREIDIVVAAEARLIAELVEFGVIKGQNRAGRRYFDETEREIVRAVSELARYGVGGRNLRVFRSSADREAQLLQSILAPALRSRNPERRKEAIETLENLASVTTHLKHLLLINDLRRIAG